MMVKRSLYIFLFLFPLAASAQVQLLNAAEIKHRLQKLAVTGRVLYIAAHPDDENTRLLTWLAKAQKVRTGYLSLTRGDGGQNLIGTEQAEELGLIRTQELLSARKIDGAEQFFSRAVDFGFSKTADETFQFWNKERVLSDVVRVIRMFRPDVIITRFPPDTRAGHGNHTASAILAVEAFSAAADPTRFPELGKPWETTRVLWNTFNFGGNNTTSPDQLKIDVGGYSPLLGKSYGELAAQSRSQHKTQGFGAASQRGPEYEYFALLAGKPAQTDLFENVDITWNRIPGGKMISSLIDSINESFDIMNPSGSVKSLLELRSMIMKVDDQGLRTSKLKEINDLILSCAGIWFEINAQQPEFSTGDSIPVKIQAISLMADSLKLPVSISETISGMPPTPLSGKLITIEKKIAPQPFTQPYWLNYDRSAGSYNSGPEAMDRPENELVSGSFQVRIADQTITLRRPVQYRYTDPVKGEVYKPLIIGPPVILSVDQKMIFSENAGMQQLKVKITAQKDDVKGNVRLQTSDRSVVPGPARPFDLKHKGDAAYVDLQLKPGKKVQENRVSEIQISADIDGQIYSYDQRTISYDHVPAITYFPVATVKYLNSDIKISGKRLAYISGAGDRIPESLKLIGYTVDEFTAEQLADRDLSVYDAIIAGVRLYNVDAAISRITPQLMGYVKNGGIYLVQYNVNNGLKSTVIGPYPFKISNSRVTDEHSPVTILNSFNSVLNYPNKITDADFSNWVQERGLYFVTDFDRNYTPILSMRDPGENENNGSLIVSDYGKGRFVYTSLSFFRQLPAGVPGAYRLFVNLIAKKR